VLELQAGTGVVTGPLTRAGVDVVAIEASGEGRAQLRRALPGVAVLAARADRLPLAPARAAAVLLTEPDLLASRAVVEELDRVLAADGVVVLLARSGTAGAIGLERFERAESTEHAAGAGELASVVTSWRRS
jgi:hypothetical protein